MSGYITFGLDENGDIALDGNGNFTLLMGEPAIEQNCLTAMKAQFGEMILQPNDGLPYLTDVWLQRNLIKWEAAARVTLLGIDGVTGLKSLTTQVVNGSLEYTAIIQTVFSNSLEITATITQGET